MINPKNMKTPECAFGLRVYIGKAEVKKIPPCQRLYRPILLTDCEKSREVHKVGFMVLGSRQCTI